MRVCGQIRVTIVRSHSLFGHCHSNWSEHHIILGHREEHCGASGKLVREENDGGGGGGEKKRGGKVRGSPRMSGHELGTSATQAQPGEPLPHSTRQI